MTLCSERLTVTARDRAWDPLKTGPSSIHGVHVSFSFNCEEVILANSHRVRLITCLLRCATPPWKTLKKKAGSAPVFDACGRAGGGPKPTGGHGEYIDTKFAKFGDNGSQVLPKMPSGAVWVAGSTVQTWWSCRANHGGMCRSII